ncbi:MAG: cohesin domain-containing protein [Candidatus Poribacteria bacterium]|nr:cohesin domain-containing protein [Candidatus Poribacteria bacterium]
MKNKMFILMLSVLLISLFSWNVFSEDTDPRIGLYYQLSRQDDQVSVDVFIQSASNVAGCQVWLTYKPAVLDYVDAIFEKGDYFSANAFYGERQLESLSDTETRLRFAVASSPIPNKNSGIIATLTFKVLNAEENLSLSLVDGDLKKGTGTLFSDAAGSLSLPGVVEPDDHSNIPAWGTPIDINIGQALSSSHSRIGKIDYKGDVDYFKIEVTSPGELTVSSEESSIEMVGQLLDSNGDSVAADNRDGAAQNFRIVHRVTDATLSDPKIYYVEVTAFHNNSTGDYRFSAKLTSLKNENEPDLVIESVTVSQLDGKSKDKGITVNPGDKFDLYVSLKNKGAATSDQTRVLYYRSRNSSTVSKTLIQEGGKVSLSGNEVVRRKLTVTAPDIEGVYYYSACMDSVSNEIQTANSCSSEDEVVRVDVKAGLPRWLIQNVAHSADGYTYFVVEPPANIALPLERYSPEDLTKHSLKGLSGYNALRHVTKCSVTLHTPDSGYFMFPLESPQGEKTTAEETTEKAAKTLKFGLKVVGQIPDGLTQKGGWFDKLKNGVLKFASKVLGLLQIVGVVIDLVIGFVAPDDPTTPPTLTVEPPSNIWEVLGEDGFVSLFGLESVEYQPFLPPMLFVVREDLSSIDITVVQDYNVDGVSSSYRWEATWDLKDNISAAPSAHPMSLADYPPFQSISPEVQEYLLRYFGEFSSTAAVNSEAWQMPEETSLLPNYPNPFNPETWIPYQLAEPAEVTVTIYGIDGTVVRVLDLGHQRIGMYHSRSRAAYWNGRNAVGEPVASGVYFYTLSTESTRDSVTASDFSATRRMLILK